MKFEPTDEQRKMSEYFSMKAEEIKQKRRAMTLAQIEQIEELAEKAVELAQCQGLDKSSEWVMNREPSEDEADSYGRVWIFQNDGQVRSCDYRNVNGRAWQPTRRPAPPQRVVKIDEP